jgi:hypothetical protein
MDMVPHYAKAFASEAVLGLCLFNNEQKEFFDIIALFMLVIYCGKDHFPSVDPGAYVVCAILLYLSGLSHTLVYV